VCLVHVRVGRTHRRSDLHQDHRTAADLTWNLFRDHFFLEYEIPEYEGDLSAPYFFVPLTEDEART
jgi:LmbE family N-acetylglucosaminyl deacetylase